MNLSCEVLLRRTVPKSAGNFVRWGTFKIKVAFFRYYSPVLMSMSLVQVQSYRLQYSKQLFTNLSFIKNIFFSFSLNCKPFRSSKHFPFPFLHTTHALFWNARRSLVNSDGFEMIETWTDPFATARERVEQGRTKKIFKKYFSKKNIWI